MPDGRIPLRRSLIVAVVAVVLATAARWAFDRQLGEGLPLVTYYIALAFVAVLGDRNATIALTLLSTLAGTYYFVPPRSSFAVADAADSLRLAAFVATGFAVALLAGRLHQTRLRLRRA